MEESLSKAPTVIASSELPGVPIVPLPAEFPAAINSVMSLYTISLAIRFTLSSSDDCHSITPNAPRDIDATLMLNLYLLSIVHCIPAITTANEPEPPESRTFTPTNLACGAIPGLS